MQIFFLKDINGSVGKVDDILEVVDNKSEKCRRLVSAQFPSFEREQKTRFVGVSCDQVQKFLSSLQFFQ